MHLPDLDIGSISDELGYFVLEAVPRGVQVVAVHRTGYEAIEQAVEIVPGEVWEVQITPRAISLEGVEVRAATGPELEAALTGRRSDFISPSTVAKAAERTNKLLDVFRSKAPPRLRIRQKGASTVSRSASSPRAAALPCRKSCSREPGVGRSSWRWTG